MERQKFQENFNFFGFESQYEVARGYQERNGHQIHERILLGMKVIVSPFMEGFVILPYTEEEIFPKVPIRYHYKNEQYS